MTPAFKHDFNFDPSYGYNLAQLLRVGTAPEPMDYAYFWQTKYAQALALTPELICSPSRTQHADYRVEDVHFTSTDGIKIGGWLYTPKSGVINKAVIMGHGYGGRDAPDQSVPFTDTAILFICFRGLSRSRCAGVSDNPAFHVLHNIDKPDAYILRGCVEDIWLAASALLKKIPQTTGHLGYAGISFSGGVGAMALAWDKRFTRAALNVPSFGHQALRLTLATTGSGAAVQHYFRNAGQSNLMATLQYYDAATAAKRITTPLHCALALFDPVVAPPGQFAIYNAAAGEKRLFVLDAGHFEYPQKTHQHQLLFAELQTFFKDL